MKSVASVMTILLVAVISPVQGQVYRCTGPDGQAIFSQAPCAPDAEIIDIRAAKSDPTSAARMREMARANASETEHRQRLAQAERELRRLEHERRVKLAEVDERHRLMLMEQSRQNDTGWLRSLSKQLREVESLYDPQIKAQHEEIARLRSQGPDL
ncbi:DUF4124 domain-containing protein [Ectothiorhodospira shaposhnikovii]|uniref:DUF4124 domain-containing protein n=1 Tax=Ectothiorhodospira shaposhnikovii TaxID=1054 RepID=UPI0039A0921F